MPISVKCCECGKTLKAPDALAGQKARCPDCGAIVGVPIASHEMQASSGQQESNVGQRADDEAAFPVDGVNTRKPCPMCGEWIAVAATKCRFCGETLSSTVRQREWQTTSDFMANQLTGGDIAICVLCFPVACVVGVIAIITGQPARGLKMIGLALAMPFLLGAILSIFQ